MRISRYPAKVTPAASDLVVIVDVTDLSQSSSGTTKKATLSSLATAIGGGGGGGTVMPWNLLGGWVGSNYDIARALNGVTGAPVTMGSFLVAQAVVVDTATAFSKVEMLGAAAMTGTGSQVVVTDHTGAWVAHVASPDSIFQGISSSPEPITFNLNTTVTPGAAQTVYYVMVLFPTSTVSVPPQLWGGSDLYNWISSQSEVAFVSAASSFSGSIATIPNPQALSGLTVSSNFTFWCALK